MGARHAVSVGSANVGRIELRALENRDAFIASAAPAAAPRKVVDFSSNPPRLLPETRLIMSCVSRAKCRLRSGVQYRTKRVFDVR